MEALAVVGLVSNIICFVQTGSKLVKRIQDYNSNIAELPSAFKGVSLRLPLLIEIIDRTKAQAESGKFTVSTQDALQAVVEDCNRQIESLDNIFTKILPDTSDTSWKRKRKALSSVAKESKIEQISRILQGHVLILTYHQAMGVVTPVADKPVVDTVFFVPFTRDPNFVGRADVFDEIDRRFKSESRVSLAGIGGVGKSQIALEYSFRFRDLYPTSNVLWIHASTGARFTQGIDDIAGALCIPGWDDPNVDNAKLVSAHLSDAPTPWLLILDNVDDISMLDDTEPASLPPGAKQPRSLSKFLNCSHNGNVIITTRDKRIGMRLFENTNPIMIPPLDREEARFMLCSKLSREQDWDNPTIGKILDMLGDLPLALKQTTAFINENDITIEEYLRLLRGGEKEARSLLGDRTRDSRRYFGAENSILHTWKLSFDIISKRSPRAANILFLMSRMDRQGIPAMLLHQVDESYSTFTQAIGVLKAFSLIEEEKDTSTYGMHRLVQVSVRMWLEVQGSERRWQEEALSVLSTCFPDGEYESWKVCSMLAPHVQAVTAYEWSTEAPKLQCARLNQRSARYCETRGFYLDAYRKYTMALETCQEILGSTSNDVRKCKSGLASVLRLQGLYEPAAAIYLEILTEREGTLDADDADTISSMSDYALVLGHQGDFAASERINRKALEAREKSLGWTHPDTLTSANSLALTLDYQGKYDEAEKLSRQALEGRRTILGELHPRTLWSMRHLALVLGYQGKIAEAESLHILALQGRQEVLGDNHPDTLMSFTSLAWVLRHRQSYAEAENLDRKTLRRKQDILGREHNITLASMTSLADSLRCQGKLGEAASLYVEALDIYKRTLGWRHAHTLTTASEYGLTLQKQGRYDDAEVIFRQALEGKKLALGLRHPATQENLRALARNYELKGQSRRARALLLSMKFPWWEDVWPTQGISKRRAFVLFVILVTLAALYYLSKNRRSSLQA
ncbi:hypothetical protein N7537_001533 [Penicillium hordei]|uniref:NACHT-NTPase and P-loop NTPases N-terminal domain-containing protein n=1 Tax=Penicillium hordei TaxID=40994 RepID=A0AAD6EGU6_9EURO|nr:uncharacterized protein N7537_001533 [Penicillium hordei]KAJ5616419.1 hypothetical protein N7537_001533 [Penicillium hordei]